MRCWLKFAFQKVQESKQTWTNVSRSCNLGEVRQNIFFFFALSHGDPKNIIKKKLTCRFMNIIFFSPTFSTFVDSQRKNEHHISVPSERDCDFWTVKSRKSVNSDSKWGARNTLNVQAFKGENKSLFCLCYKIMTGILMELYRCLHHATFWRLHGSYLCSTYKVRDAFGACVCEQDIKKSESWDRKICKSDSKWKQRSARGRAGTERAWPRARYTCVLTHARTHMAQFGAINHAGFGLRDRLTFTFRTFFCVFGCFFLVN